MVDLTVAQNRMTEKGSKRARRRGGGRGIGGGFQFKVRKVITVDLAAGYIMEDVNSSLQNYGEVEFTDLKAIKDDGLKLNINLGVSF